MICLYVLVRSPGLLNAESALPVNPGLRSPLLQNPETGSVRIGMVALKDIPTPVTPTIPDSEFRDPSSEFRLRCRRWVSVISGLILYAWELGI